MKEQDTGRQLQRGLKSRHIQMIALGGIIGSGYFLGSGYVVSKAGPASVLAYLLGGLIVYAVMVCLGELAVARPVSGSFVSYTRDYISPAWACGVGWCYWLTWVTYVPSEMIAAGIIMNTFFPVLSSMLWAVMFGLVITFINLSRVSMFGEMEFWLALIKIGALFMFCGLALFILFGGFTGSAIGTSILLSDGGFAPNGYWAVLLTMVIILVNFQGSEIIGLAAAESEDPAHTIPATVRQVTVRIIALYIIPMLLLVAIFPWEQAGLESSVFASALTSYGLEWAGAVFSFVVLTAAISCSNSGLYGATRAMYALSKEKMAPEWLGRLNNFGVPQNATALSIAVCWLVILLYTFDQEKVIYTYLLALSGFTGAIVWISICWSQYNFRKQLTVEEASALKYKAPFFPYITQFGIWVQIASLVFIAFTPELRVSLYFGLPLLVLPIAIYRWRLARKTALSEL